MRLDIERTWDGAPLTGEERVELELSRGAGSWVMSVSAPFHDDPAPARPAGSCEMLWEHEAVECFLVGDAERYLEIEVGPHGHYLLLSLQGRRNIVRQGMLATYDARIDRARRRWQGRIELPIELGPEPVLRANAFALHGAGSARRYLCFHPLPAAVADFHQIERFPAVDWAAFD